MSVSATGGAASTAGIMDDSYDCTDMLTEKDEDKDSKDLNFGTARSDTLSGYSPLDTSALDSGGVLEQGGLV